MPEWQDGQIIQLAVIHTKRLHKPDDLDIAPVDIRRLVMPLSIPEFAYGIENPVAARPTKIPELPREIHVMPFDQRAQMCWEWVNEHIEYVNDPIGKDFWQFPLETIRRRAGDCDDLTFLVASLLRMVGISSACIRAVLGCVEHTDAEPHNGTNSGRNGAEHAGCDGHAWPIYRDEEGHWQVLEGTLGRTRPATWVDIGTATEIGAYGFRYHIHQAVNEEHYWQIARRCDRDSGTRLAATAVET